MNNSNENINKNKGNKPITREELDRLIEKAQNSNDWSRVENANVSEIADMSNLFYGIKGIEEVDMWRVTSGYTGSNDPITANWERADTDNFSVLGTGLSESSGIFTFPSTGVYLIIFQASFSRNGDSRVINEAINVTTDNSSFSDIAASATFIQQTESDSTSAFSKTSAIVDVTSTSNVKISFTAGASNVVVNGNTNAQQTGFISIKLAET